MVQDIGGKAMYAQVHMKDRKSWGRHDRQVPKVGQAQLYVYLIS